MTYKLWDPIWCLTEIKYSQRHNSPVQGHQCVPPGLDGSSVAVQGHLMCLEQIRAQKKTGLPFPSLYHHRVRWLCLALGISQLHRGCTPRLHLWTVHHKLPAVLQQSSFLPGAPTTIQVVTIRVLFWKSLAYFCTMSNAFQKQGTIRHICQCDEVQVLTSHRVFRLYEPLSFSPCKCEREVRPSARKHGVWGGSVNSSNFPSNKNTTTIRGVWKNSVWVMKTAMAFTPGRGFRTLPPEIRTEVSEMEDYKEDCGIFWILVY